MIASSSRVAKAFSVATYALTRPRRLLASMNLLYNEVCMARSPLRAVSLESLAGTSGSVAIENFTAQDGNVSPLELLCLASLVRGRAPRTVLELGTFNGNTTLQIAANLPPEGLVYTLDLPVGAASDARAAPNDHHYVASEQRQRERLRYEGTACASRVRQVYGNSLEVDFLAVCEQRRPDFIFVDAGHSYECVRSDTEKSFGVLAEGGCIAWHDYNADWPDVYNYLNGLGRERNLVRISGTALVLYARDLP